MDILRRWSGKWRAGVHFTSHLGCFLGAFFSSLILGCFFGTFFSFLIFFILGGKNQYLYIDPDTVQSVTFSGQERKKLSVLGFAGFVTANNNTDQGRGTCPVFIPCITP